MEVGRVGGLRIRNGSIVRLPLVGDRLYECHDQKKDLTGAGLLMEVARDLEQSGQSTFTRTRIKPPGGGCYARITVGSQVNTILWATGVPVIGSQKSCAPAQARQAGRWISCEPAPPANLRVSQDGLTPGGQVSSSRLAEPAISNVP